MRRLLYLIGAVVLLVSGCASNQTAVREVPVNGNVFKVITVIQLKTMLDNKDFTLVNVHIPYAGEIKGTDLFIPYDQIDQNLNKLPDKNARIVVYCRSGMMSKIAATTLTELGYTNVMDVSGGMAAWQNAGYQLIQ